MLPSNNKNIKQCLFPSTGDLGVMNIPVHISDLQVNVGKDAEKRIIK